MKIYPKIRKLQSGGQLSEVNFYPTVQYTPTSNVAITQGAWAPLKQNVLPDATMDPDILKDAKGLSNEQSQFIQNTNSTLVKYNRLNELEKRSNVGQSMLASLKSDLARVNELDNNAKRNAEAIKTVEANAANDVLSTDERGNVGVLTYKRDDNGNLMEDDIEYIDPSLVGTGLHRPLTNKEVTTYRGTLSNTVNKTVLDDLVTNTKGRVFADKSLDAFSKTGKDQINSEIERQYGIYHGDNLIKAQTIGQGKISNKYQLSVASDVALRTLPQAEERGLKALALQKLFDPNNTGSFSMYKRGEKGPVKTEFSFDNIRKTLYDLSTQISKEKDPTKRSKLASEKSQIVKNFQNDYVKSYVQSYFNAQEDISTNYKETYSTLSKDLYGTVGGQGDLAESDVTLNTTIVAELTPGMSEKFAVTFDKNDPTATIHTQEAVSLAATKSPVSTNTETKGGAPMLFNSWGNDPGKKLIVDNTETINGNPLDMYSPQTQSNLFRVGTGEVVDAFMYVDAQTDQVNSLTGTSVVKGTNTKWVDKLATEKERIKANHTTKAGFDKKGANDEWAEWLKEQKLLQVRAWSNKIVLLIPKDTDNPADKLLMNSRSNYEKGLTDAEKILLANKVGYMNNKFKVNNQGEVDKVYPSKVTTTSGVPTVEIDGKDYVVVVKNMTSMFQDLATVNSVSKDEMAQDLNKKMTGQIQRSTTGISDMLDQLKSYGHMTGKQTNPEVISNKNGGILPQFTPQEIKIKPLSLKDLY